MIIVTYIVLKVLLCFTSFALKGLSFICVASVSIKQNDCVKVLSILQKQNQHVIEAVGILRESRKFCKAVYTCV